MKQVFYFIIILLLVSCKVSQIEPEPEVNKLKSLLENRTDQFKEANEVSFVDTTEYPPATKSLIPFYNASFENNMSNHSSVPVDWLMCDDLDNSPPDIHSNKSNFFEVRRKASHGEKYVGMVVRKNGSYEHLAQELDIALEVDRLYEFKIDLAHSKQFISLSKATLKEINFKGFTTLRVWGTEELCFGKDFLHQTIVVNHLDWQSYTIQFKAKRPYKYIILEAFYDSEKDRKLYNGNLMLDNLSPIKKIE